MRRDLVERAEKAFRHAMNLMNKAQFKARTSRRWASHAIADLYQEAADAFEVAADAIEEVEHPKEAEKSRAYAVHMRGRADDHRPVRRRKRGPR